MWLATLQIGTWSNGTAGAVTAFSEASSAHMPMLNEKFPPPGGIDGARMTRLLQLCGVTFIAALLLSRHGLPKHGNI